MASDLTSNALTERQSGLCALLAGVGGQGTHGGTEVHCQRGLETVGRSFQGARGRTRLGDLAFAACPGSRIERLQTNRCGDELTD
jgi:hypothetical protein